MLPELEQSDAGQRRASLTGNGRQMYSSQHQPTVQQDYPAVSSNPPEPSSQALTVPSQQLPAASSGAMQQRSADTDHLADTLDRHSDAVMDAPADPVSTALGPDAPSQPSPHNLPTRNARHPPISRASASQRRHGQTPTQASRHLTENSSGRLPQLAASHRDHQPDQGAAAQTGSLPRDTCPEESTDMLISGGLQDAALGMSSQNATSHAHGSLVLGKRSR